MARNHRDTDPTDVLVLFAITGDLAHKMIIPALYALVKRGTLTVPIIAVALPKWSEAQLHARVIDSLQKSGKFDDRKALARLLSLLSYVSGDYNDQSTFGVIKESLGKARRPAHYLALPPSLFNMSSRGWEPPAWPKMHVSLSKNRSGVIWHLHGNSIALHIPCSPKMRSSASITSLARRRS